MQCSKYIRARFYTGRGGWGKSLSIGERGWDVVAARLRGLVAFSSTLEEVARSLAAPSERTDLCVRADVRLERSES